jgi:DNA-binding transcriptional LysR family regulator
MLDLDQLSAFLAIAQCGTVTAAARKLHRTQSAISRRISLLEDALGARLFERRGAQVALTDAGRAFFPFAESALAAVASGRDAALAQLAPRAGTVSIAIVGTLVGERLAQALGELLRTSLQLSVLTTTSSEVSRLVRRGDANLGVRYFADEDPQIACEEIGVERMCVVTSAQHARDSSDSTAQRRWIGFPLTRTSKDDFGRLLHRRLTAAGMGSAEVMAVDSLSAQKRLVEAGLGLALLPESSVRDEVQRGSLLKVAMPRIQTSIPIVLIARRDGYVSPAARVVTAMLKDTFGAKRAGQGASR